MLQIRRNALGQSVEMEATNRPVKIAYLVPHENLPQAHLILDAVFYESYTRWGGGFTLAVPTAAESFLDLGFRDWTGQSSVDTQLPLCA